MVRQRGLCGKEWTGCNKFLSSGVNGEVETLECASAKQDLIARFCEHNLVDGEGVCNAEYGEAHTARHDFTVRHDEANILFFSDHADFLKFYAWNPGVLASRVNKSLRYPNTLAPVGVILNLAAYVECAHAARIPSCRSDSTSFLPNRRIHGVFTSFHKKSITLRASRSAPSRLKWMLSELRTRSGMPLACMM